MAESIMLDNAKDFAVEIVNLCNHIKENKKEYTLTTQLMRSGTSIGANIHESKYAHSTADFVSKMQIALKECYETDYWLGLFKDTNMITLSEFDSLYRQCSKIRKLLIASITTAKSHRENDI